MSRILVLAAAFVLVALRLPSLVQPMGADQALYAYVGERVRAGGLPYRDAWDQKPPAIHFLYAGMRTVWSDDAVVPAADLAAAAATAILLYVLGSAIGPRGTGEATALLFLLFSNPAFTRLNGVRLRSQCETFIAVAVTAAFVLLARKAARKSSLALFWPGILFGIAFTFKYNTALFAVAGLAALWLWKRPTIADVVWFIAGCVVPPAALLLVFAVGGALRPLIDATLLYNIQYSGETYGGAADVVRYLVSFPVERARADALWTLGGAGCILLLVSVGGDRQRLFPIVWVAAACGSIAINGSRSLPQYFIQANPALALAAGWATILVWTWLRAGLGRSARVAAIPIAILVAYATVRVNQYDKLAEQTIFDARYALGSIDRSTYLARYDDGDRKYSAPASEALGAYLKTHSGPTDRVYVFGFSCAAYVKAERTSASRFFWSRPIIVGFNAGRPGYGIEGLLSDLHVNRPSVIALQQQDWPDTQDSAAFFMSTPSLAGWLQAYYTRGDGPQGFDVWLRRSAAP